MAVLSLACMVPSGSEASRLRTRIFAPMDGFQYDDDDAEADGAGSSPSPRRHPQHLSPPLSVAELSEAVAAVLVEAEELRRSLATEGGAGPDVEAIADWRDRLERLLALLAPLQGWPTRGDAAAATDEVAAAAAADLLQHGHDRVRHVAQRTLQAALKLREPDPDDPYLAAPLQLLRSQGQAAVARVVELNLMLLVQDSRGSDPTAQPPPSGPDPTEPGQRLDDVVQSYVSFQRHVLRQRARPFIARLVQARRDGIPSLQLLAQQMQRQDDHAEPDGGDGDGDGDDVGVTLQQHHAPVLADILGQAAALIHPLAMWLHHLPAESDRTKLQRLVAQLCVDSIQTVNTQAQELVQTIATWYWEDRPVDESTLQGATEDNPHLSQTQLALLDAQVEELALTCQVQARYRALLVDATGGGGGDMNDDGAPSFVLHTTLLQDQLLPEFSWRYAALERHLALQQWHAAVALAVPVPIVIGTRIHVPSVVEDAQYLAARALERAARTEAPQAVGTVAHAVSHDVWSTELGGVCAALLDERGCWSDAVEDADGAAAQRMDTAVSSPPPSGFESGFVSALMDALDEEEPPPRRPQVREGTGSVRPSRAPGSGSFLSSLVGQTEATQQLRIDADFCVLNGFHAACTACQALVEFLDTLLPSDGAGELPGESSADDKAMAMIRLAREELVQYEVAYQAILDERVNKCYESWCGCAADQGANWEGKLLPKLRVFFELEEYMLDEKAFGIAEKDERLHQELLIPLNDCHFLMQLSDKCDADVLGRMGKIVIKSFVALILDVLWRNEKGFTDWGSLLLSKQVRLLQRFCGRILNPMSSDAPLPNMLAHWERLSQVVCVLQIEKPADWLCYTSSLTPDEVHNTMRLRADFSPEAIQAVVGRLKNRSDGFHTM